MGTYKLTTVSRALCRNLMCNNHTISNRHLIKSVRNLSTKSSKRISFSGKTFVKSVAVGAALGIGYSVYASIRSKDSHLINEQTEIFTIDHLPDVPITRKIVNAKDKSNLDLVLFQYQTCPFCCKVRAFLDSSGFTYSIVEVDAVLRQSIKWSPYKKVPMLLARTKNGKYVQLNDSSMIISALSTFLVDPTVDISDLVKLYPNVSYEDNHGHKKYDILNKYFVMYGNKSPKNRTKDNFDDERNWREWVDHHFIHLISPNVYRTADEALETFEWFSDAGEWDQNFPKWERNMMVYVGAAAMWLISKRLKKRHNLTDDVRQHIYDACNLWTDDLDKKKTKFHGGKTPDLADLALYGALTSMEGCKTFTDILQNTKIEPWFRLMKTHVSVNKGTVISRVH